MFQVAGRRSSRCGGEISCRLNFAMKKACNGMGWGFVRHGPITLKVPAYYGKDGVHLTGTGLPLFMLNMAGALGQAGCT